MMKKDFNETEKELIRVNKLYCDAMQTLGLLIFQIKNRTEISKDLIDIADKQLKYFFESLDNES